MRIYLHVRKRQKQEHINNSLWVGDSVVFRPTGKIGWNRMRISFQNAWIQKNTGSGSQDPGQKPSFSLGLSSVEWPRQTALSLQTWKAPHGRSQSVASGVQCSSCGSPGLCSWAQRWSISKHSNQLVFPWAPCEHGRLLKDPGVFL